MRWARTALCTLAVAVAALLGTAGRRPPPAALRRRAARRRGGPPALTLVSQTPWVTPDQPWFNLAARRRSPPRAPASGLHVSLTFYGRIDDALPAPAGRSAARPEQDVLLPRRRRRRRAPGAGGLSGVGLRHRPARRSSATPPATGTGRLRGRRRRPSTSAARRCTGDVRRRLPGLGRARPAGLVDAGRALHHLPHVPGARAPVGDGGPLRVGVVLPGRRGRRRRPWPARWRTTATSPTTLAVSPLAVERDRCARTRTAGDRALAQLAGARAATRCSTSPTCPINLAALSEAGIAGEIRRPDRPGRRAPARRRPPARRRVRGSTPPRRSPRATPATWPAGLQVAGRRQLVLSDGDLAPGGLEQPTPSPSPSPSTSGTARPSRPRRPTRSLSARFTADPGQPGPRRRAAARRALLRPLRERVPARPAGRRGRAAAGLAALRRLRRHAAGRADGQPGARAGHARASCSTRCPSAATASPRSATCRPGPAGHGITHTAADTDRARPASSSSSFSATPSAGTRPSLTTLVRRPARHRGPAASARPGAPPR